MSPGQTDTYDAINVNVEAYLEELVRIVEVGVDVFWFVVRRSKVLRNSSFSPPGTFFDRLLDASWCFELKLSTTSGQNTVNADLGFLLFQWLPSPSEF